MTSDALARERVLDEDAAADLAQAVVARDHLASQPLRCLEFYATADGPSIFDIDVREHHSRRCGGDLRVAPLLFTLVVDGLHKTVLLRKADEPDRRLMWRAKR